MNFIEAYRSDRSPLSRPEQAERMKNVIPNLEDLIEKIKAGEVVDLFYFYHDTNDDRETPELHGWRTAAGSQFCLMLTELLAMVSGNSGQRGQNKFLKLATELRDQRLTASIRRLNKLFNN